MRLRIVAGLAAGLLVAITSPALSQDQATRASADDGPGIHLPQVQFPQRAFDRDVSDGRAVIQCSVRPDGNFIDCLIVSEDPPGAGFGQEALAAARQGYVVLDSGEAIPEGVKATFPITFAKPD